MIYLVSGGADSGKSYLSEKIMMQFSGDKLYIATMENKSSEAQIRIKRHREMRKNKGFITLEREKYFNGINISNYNAVILECLGTLCANHLYGGGSAALLYDDVNYLMENSKNIVIVTNDIAGCSITYSSEMYNYMKVLNKCASYIAEKSNCVVEAVCGCALVHKGELWV